MKLKHFIFATLAFLSATSFAQYESTNRYESASKAPAVDYKKLDEQVGKEYWIKVNPNAISKKKFKASLDLHSYKAGEFVVTTDLKFTVIAWELNSIKTPHLKVRFEDGKEAYIQVLFWDKNKDVLDDVFNGSEYYDFSEYFFKGNPDEILAAWKDKKAKQKAKAEADYKAKGGVKIGMTKEQVLKSNWGKPESVNATTNAGGVREQWVYGGRNYLYFTNGILTSIQN